MEAYDANYVGGDINGGIGDWRQLLFRPVVRWNPYSTPDPAIFLCSSSTPPGGGVHGMGGRHAARARTTAPRSALRPASGRQETQNSLPSGSASTVHVSCRASARR